MPEWVQLWAAGWGILAVAIIAFCVIPGHLGGK